MLPPHDTEAEVMALGAALGFPEARGKMTDLQPSDFFREEHGWIWAAIQRVPDVTVESVCSAIGPDINRFAPRGARPNERGEVYVAELPEKVFTHHGCEVYARDIINCARLRRLIQFAGQVAQRAYEGHSAYAVAEYASDHADALKAEWNPTDAIWERPEYRGTL